MTTPMPEKVKNLVVMNVNDVDAVSKTVDFVFSAVDMTKEEIRAIEEAYAKTETPVVSNNSAHRWTPDVPMVIPEINPDHFEVIYRSKAELLRPELHSGTQCVERVRAVRGSRYYISGYFRSRKDL